MGDVGRQREDALRVELDEVVSVLMARRPAGLRFTAAL
jgi:hypothetical protein